MSDIEAQEENGGVANGWIEWNAKKQLGCPVAPDDLVDVVCFGRPHYGEEAAGWSWVDCEMPITHYRLHDSINPPMPGSRDEVIAELVALLVESQRSIGGDWRKRRDAKIAEAVRLGLIPQPQDKEA